MGVLVVAWAWLVLGFPFVYSFGLMNIPASRKLVEFEGP